MSWIHLWHNPLARELNSVMLIKEAYAAELARNRIDQFEKNN
jgi:hypothetical protein